MAKITLGSYINLKLKNRDIIYKAIYVSNNTIGIMTSLYNRETFYPWTSVEKVDAFQ